LLASIGAAAISIVALSRAAWENEIVGALLRGEDRDIVARRHGGNAVAAKIYYLLQRDRTDEAQALIETASPDLDASVRAGMVFNYANALVRAAIGKIEKGDLDAAIPLVMLAKERYRQALRLEPGAWDAKFNFDVAMRLVRDFPGYEKETDEPPADAPKRLWTDLPGVPRGEP
jgi:mxaK protein